MKVKSVPEPEQKENEKLREDFFHCKPVLSQNMIKKSSTNEHKNVTLGKWKLWPATERLKILKNTEDTPRGLLLIILHSYYTYQENWMLILSYLKHWARAWERREQNTTKTQFCDPIFEKINEWSRTFWKAFTHGKTDKTAWNFFWKRKQIKTKWHLKNVSLCTQFFRIY